MSSLEDVRALVRVRTLIDSELHRLALLAIGEGSPRSAVATALGISRASLYRQFEIDPLGDGFGSNSRSSSEAGGGVVAPAVDPYADHGLPA